MSETSRRTILLIEAESGHRARTIEVIEAEVPDMQVVPVSTGDEAIRYLATHPVAGVVLDDAVMDAIALLDEIRLEPEAPPVVMITDRLDETVALEAMQRGAVDVLVKNSASDRTLPLIIDRAIATQALHDQLRDANLQFRGLVERSNDAFYILVGDRFRYVNQRFAELFGYTTAEILAPQMSYDRLVAPESQPMVAERSRLRSKQPLPTRYEFRGQRKDGSTFDLEVSVSYIEFDGEPAVLGIPTDITGRKAYERTLLRKNHELSVLNAVAAAITEVRDLGAILEGVVERLIELLGVDAAGIWILDDAGTKFASVHCRGASETFIREMRTRTAEDGVLGLALVTRELQRIEDIHEDERIQHGAASHEGFRSAVALPLISHDRPSGVVTVFTREPRQFLPEDISLFTAVARQIAVAIENARLYKKASEGVDRLQALSEIARAIGSTLDVEGVFRIVGERLQRLVPYRRASLIILRRDDTHASVRTIDRPSPGEDLVVRLHEPIDVQTIRPYRRALESKQVAVVEPGKMQLQHPSGPDVKWWSAAVPIVADHAAVGVFVVSSDERFRQRDLDLLGDLAAHMAISLKNARVFSDLEGAYRDLSDAKDRLVRSEKLQSLGEMAAGVAHDFNNVLSAILGRAQMLRVMIRDPEMRKSLKVIEKAALDGAGTVRRIQEFAKEKAEGELVEVHLNPIVRDAVDLTTTRVNDMGIDIDLQVSLGEVGPVKGNATELREVLTNLIHNAIDAMPHGGRLAIRTDAEAERAWFEVEDTGIGMDEETKNKVFDPFFTTKGTRGTGLGMSVSYGIVQRHKGEIAVRSKRGQGSTIRVLLPMTQGDLTYGPHEGLTPLPQLEESPNPSNAARILVIDDDVAVRDVLADILRSGAHEVVAVGSGAEGLARFADGQFDVVFTDLGMPGMNGWEVAQSIKAKSPRTPVGLITGWGSTIDEDELSTKGVDLVVAKPFRYDQVLQLVTDVMGSRISQS
ncbi:MAG: response regulator [Deltaproteobacteria bacterium]